MIETSKNGRRLQVLALATSAVVSMVGKASATNVYFDVNSTTAGSGVASGTTYTWSDTLNSTLKYWSTSSAGTSTSTAWNTTAVNYSSTSPDVFFSAGTDASGLTYGIKIDTTGAINVNSITVDEGTLQITGATGSSGLNVGAGGITLTSGDSATLSYSAVLALTANQTWTSSSTSTFTITSSSSGGAAIGGSSYALTLAGAGSFVFAGSGSNSMGSVNINGASVTVGSSLTNVFGTGQLTLSAGSLAPTSGGATVANNFAIAGGFAFGGSSSNHLTLSGAGTTSGVETVTLNDTVSTGTIFGTSGAASTLALGGNLTLAGTGNTNINDVISGSGYSLTDSSSGTVTLAASNTFTGGVSLSAGSLVINNANALGTTAGTFTIGAGTTLSTTAGILSTAAYTQSWAGDFTFNAVGNLYLAGTALLTANRTVTVTGNNLLQGGSVVIGDGGNNYSLTKAGPGFLYLSASNTYGGGTNITAGTIDFTNASALGTGSVSIGAGALDFYSTGFSSGTVTLAANVSLTNSSSSIAAGSSTVTDYLYLTGLISGTGTLNKTNIGKVYINPASGTTNSYSGGTAITSGTLDFQTIRGLPILNSNAGPITMAANTVFEYASASAGVANTLNTFSLAGVSTIYLPDSAAFTIPGVVSGTGTLAQVGGGILTLTGANTYGGGTIIGAATLSTNSLAAGGSTSGIGGSSSAAANLALLGGDLQYTGASVTTDRLLTIGVAGATLDSSGTGPVMFSNVGSEVSSDSVSGSFTLTNASTTGSYNLGTIPNIAVGQTVTGANIPSGTTVTAISYGPNTLTLSNAATLSGTNTLTFGTAYPRTLTLTGTNAGNNTINGILADSAGGGLLSLSKTGAGTWALAGSNTYSGGTTVSAGILQANTTGSGNSATGTGAVTIASGGTLAGGSTSASGQIAGTVTVNSGGTITAGSGASTGSTVGSLTTSTQTWNTGGTFAVKLDGSSSTATTTSGSGASATPGVGNDELIMTGTIGIASGSTGLTISPVLLNAANFITGNTYSYVIADAINSSTAFNALLAANAFVLPTATSSATYTLSDKPDGGSGEDLVLDYNDGGTSGAPEPTSMLLLGVVSSPLMLGRRRRRVVAE